MQRAGPRQRGRSPLWYLLPGLLLTPGCAVHRAPPGLLDPPPCRALGTPASDGSPEVLWTLRSDATERAALDAWCWAVGPALLQQRVAPASAPEPMDSVVVIDWNVHEGEADVGRLLADLRAGRLTGSPVRHFVLLLQEAVRGGAAVPATPPVWASGARRIGDPAQQQPPDIARIAEAENLSLLYAPSMRNGSAHDGRLPQDRGNAILSTMPLVAPRLIELPWERQRRVAIAASIEGRTSSGQPWTLRVVSAHFDNRNRVAALQRSLGAGRRNQARALAAALPGPTPTALGADLNTWLGGAQSAATRTLRARFPLPATLPRDATARLPGPLPGLQLDYMLFDLPSGWQAGYRVLPDAYGSDHQPLIGRIRVAGAS